MSDRKEIVNKLEQQVNFAQSTHELLNNVAFKSALTARKAQIFDEFCNTSQNDDESRKEMWRTMKNLDALETYFSQAMYTGGVAKQELEFYKQ